MKSFSHHIKERKGRRGRHSEKKTSPALWTTRHSPGDRKERSEGDGPFSQWTRLQVASDTKRQNRRKLEIPSSASLPPPPSLCVLLWASLLALGVVFLLLLRFFFQETCGVVSFLHSVCLSVHSSSGIGGKKERELGCLRNERTQRDGR